MRAMPNTSPPKRLATPAMTVRRMLRKKPLIKASCLRSTIDQSNNLASRCQEKVRCSRWQFIADSRSAITQKKRLQAESRWRSSLCNRFTRESQFRHVSENRWHVAVSTLRHAFCGYLHSNRPLCLCKFNDRATQNMLLHAHGKYASGHCTSSRATRVFAAYSDAVLASGTFVASVGFVGAPAGESFYLVTLGRTHGAVVPRRKEIGRRGSIIRTHYNTPQNDTPP